ncbi:unnamed protein product [Heligmosomoides polygyrus]|uniref:Endo/exonuclease/phosphatase domain-containing protein n=1 Tax=Heligmosomoides polygyrus TaxID=6339 RepID=A0A183GNV5_HELPZ|nr:unnamed protein product [Heligmosomoides polygyrus]
MRTVAEEPGQKYCAAQTSDVNGRSGENVYDEGTEVVNGLMPIKYAPGGDKYTERIGFALDEKATDCVLAFPPISCRLAVLTLAGTVRTHIFSVYTPTEISPDDAKDDFYSNLQAAIDLVPKTDVILLAGDFNAHVGRNRDGWEEVLGRYGIEVNDNGVRLLTFAAANGLMIGNSIFQHKQKHQLTWRAPNGNESALLDYVLVNRRFRTSIRDVRVKREEKRKHYTYHTTELVDPRGANIPTTIPNKAGKSLRVTGGKAAIDLVPKTDVILLAGDFNAHVGRNCDGWEEVLGRYGIGEVNDNGVRLLTFCRKWTDDRE